MPTAHGHVRSINARRSPPVMEAILFLLVAIVLYFVSDALVQLVERHLGRRLEHRSLLFFVLLLSLALVSFAVIRNAFTA